eukprot:364152-Chlamydomonas_euryale.AAC.3
MSIIKQEQMLMELAVTHSMRIYALFFDCRRNFVCMDRGAPWDVLRANGVPDKLVRREFMPRRGSVIVTCNKARFAVTALISSRSIAQSRPDNAGKSCHHQSPYHAPPNCRLFDGIH